MSRMRSLVLVTFSFLVIHSNAIAAPAAAPTDSTESSSSATGNFHFSPLAALLGIIDLGVDFKVNESWTLGPQLQFLNYKLDRAEVKATGLGVRGEYYLGRPVFSEGWHLASELIWMDLKVTEQISGITYDGTAKGTGLGVLAVYKWVWPSQFNLDLGVGFAAANARDIEVRSSTGLTERVEYSNATGLALEFAIGWLF